MSPLYKAYISGPLTADLECDVVRNRRKAETLARMLWHAGFSVFCPHMNTAGMVGFLESEQFVAADLLWLAHADVMFVLPGYFNSAGTSVEICYALQHQIPIIYVNEAIDFGNWLYNDKEFDSVDIFKIAREGIVNWWDKLNGNS